MAKVPIIFTRCQSNQTIRSFYLQRPWRLNISPSILPGHPSIRGSLKTKPQIQTGSVWPTCSLRVGQELTGNPISRLLNRSVGISVSLYPSLKGLKSFTILITVSLRDIRGMIYAFLILRTCLSRKLVVPDSVVSIQKPTTLYVTIIRRPHRSVEE